MNKHVEIQDNKRENELIKLFKLRKEGGRMGIDARLKVLGEDFQIELKSTSVGHVSTASPLHLDHINKWQPQHWIIGIYKKDATLDHCYYGTPENMKEWLDYWENDIKRGLKISDMLVEKIDKKMVYDIFGKKTYYTVDDARAVFKYLYTKDEYEELKNHPKGYRVRRMLEMFKKHNQTYLYRGAAINNPKINQKYYQNWIRIDGNYDKELRQHLRSYIQNKNNK